MVSHLRKMTTLSAAHAKSTTTLFPSSPLPPLSTTAVQKWRVCSRSCQGRQAGFLAHQSMRRWLVRLQQMVRDPIDRRSSGLRRHARAAGITWSAPAAASIRSCTPKACRSVSKKMRALRGQGPPRRQRGRQRPETGRSGSVARLCEQRSCCRPSLRKLYGEACRLTAAKISN
jgi:hypothetical protein